MKPSVNILILRPSYDIEAPPVNALNSISCVGRYPSSRYHYFRIVAALALIFVLLVGPAQSFAESKAPASSASPEQELEQLARAMHDNGTVASYDRLKNFAQRRSSGLLGKRAALALGYFDYTKNRYPQALRWLKIAQDDLVLREYALYWSAMAERSMNNNPGALAELLVLHRDFPGSVMTDQILQALGETAMAAQKPTEALAALDLETSIVSKSALLLLRGELREQAGRLEAAAVDYLDVYYQLPLTPQATEAGNKLSSLSTKLGDKFPKVTLKKRSPGRKPCTIRIAGARPTKIIPDCWIKRPAARTANWFSCAWRNAVSALAAVPMHSPASRFPIPRWMRNVCTRFRRSIARRNASQKCSLPSSRPPRVLPKAAGPSRLTFPRGTIIGFNWISITPVNSTAA